MSNQRDSEILGRFNPDATPLVEVRGEELQALKAALKTAIVHLEHMAAWIAKQNAGYSFESLGEDMPGIRAAIKDDVPSILEPFPSCAPGV